MRDDLVDLVRESAAEPLDTPDFEAMAVRGRRRHVVGRTATVLAGLIALVAAGVVVWPDTGPAGGPVIGEQPTTSAGAGDGVQLPAGWQGLRVGGAVFGVPDHWEVEAFAESAVLCSNMADRPTAYIATAGVNAEGACLLRDRRAVTLEAVPLSLVPEPWLEPAAAILAWEPVTVNGFDGERLERDDGGPVRTYRFPELDVWLRFAGPDSVTAEEDAILATLAAPTSDRVPAEEGEPYDAAAQMRPDLMVVTPSPAAPGETVELTFPEETPRGLGFVLERQLPDGSWDHVYSLTVSPAGRDDIPPQWSTADERLGWDDLGVGGPGPDRAVVPEPAEPDDYRICTANAGDEFCAPLRIEGESGVSPGPTEPTSEAAYSCFGPPYPASVWSEQEPAAAAEHPGRSVLESNIGPDGLSNWFLLEASEERLAVAREREVVHETGDDMLRTHDVVTVRDFGGETGWHIEQSSSCTPQLVHDEVGSASVWLEGEPQPDSRALELLVVEMACASGESAVGRIEVLELDEQQDVVEVAVGVRPREGGGTCPSNPATPFTVSLQQPLGDRTIIDTSVYPPRPLEPAPME